MGHQTMEGKFCSCQKNRFRPEVAILGADLNRGTATGDRNEKVGTNRSWVVWYVELFIIRYAYSIQFHRKESREGWGANRADTPYLSEGEVTMLLQVLQSPPSQTRFIYRNGKNNRNIQSAGNLKRLRVPLKYNFYSNNKQ